MSAGAALVPIEGVEAAVDAVTQQVASAEASARALQVTSEAEANAAGQVLREIQQRRKAAEDKRKELTGPLLESKRRIDQEFKDAMAPFDAIDQIVRGKVGTWQAEQERLRKEEEDRLEAERQERERKAREERERQEAEARAKREQAQREEAEARRLEQEAKDAADREAAEKLAAEARQKAEEAQTAESAIASLPEPELPKAVVPAAAQPAGVSTRKVWKATVEQEALVPREFLVVDEKAIREAVRNGTREIPGVRIEQVDQMAVRG